MDLFRSATRELVYNFSFAGNDLHRHGEKRSDASWFADIKQSDNCGLALYVQNKILIDHKAGNVFHDRAVADELRIDWSEAPYLGEREGRHYFAASVPATEEDFDESSPFYLENLRTLALKGDVPEGDLGALAQASALIHWHTTHRFCSRCGKESFLSEAGYRRDCAHCGGLHFPRTDPAVIMLTTDGDRCLLGSTERFMEGMYSTLAGYVEPGETFEDAVRRETQEEAGIKVGRVVYHASQPWAFPANLMIGCFSEALSSEITIDKNELSDCRWFSRAEVRTMMAGQHPENLITPPGISIAAALISHWVEHG
ncbi:MAG: NAD(+) diphosphatase [Stappiaceae bacterium]